MERGNIYHDPWFSLAASFKKIEFTIPCEQVYVRNAGIDEGIFFFSLIHEIWMKLLVSHICNDEIDGMAGNINLFFSEENL